ncbi:NERD domain-containing protein [Flavobacterium sp.]|uniref:nuclease-related domain-containing DEAD/DEAH box helicase n=1 Tax=Flavobacterium sp. TaxID=239 RepID=UPI003D2B56C6
MPVIFHPNNPIDALEKIILHKNGNPLKGEISVYRTLFNELKDSPEDFFVWHDLKLGTHSETRNPYKKNEAQIDFLLICKKGICVIEVKGGHVEFHNSEFSFRHEGNLDLMKQSPLKQVEGYKFTLKEKVLQKYSKKLFIDVCVFPFTKIDFSQQKKLFGDVVYTNVQSQRGISLTQFISNRFDSTKNKIESKHHFKFDEITDKDLNNIKSILSPSLADSNPFISNKETYEWLGLMNFEIFSGLSKNQRVLIEGIPGCGKTTFALAYADQKRHLKGLYLCWNRLLKIQIESRVKERQLTNLEVNTYFSFLKELGLNNLSFDDTIDDFRNKVLTFFSMNIKNQYDYIIIDEGQDIINRGVESLMDKLSANGKGLENGNLLFLCDSEQAYSLSEENINDDIDLLSMYFTHYQMNLAHRSVNNPIIRQLASIILEDVYQLDTNLTMDLYPDIVMQFSTFKEAKNQMVKDFLKSIRKPDSSLRGKDCILLVESSLLKSENLEELIMNDCEALTESNLTDKSNVLRYISPLKFKGLEKENVALIVKKPTAINQHEIYVGITRAKSNLKIYVVYE